MNRFVFFLLLSLTASAHGVHASLTSIDYNSESKALEVTVVMTADDIEAVLRRDTGKQIEIDRTAGAEKLVFEYLKQKLEVQGLTLGWVGMEVRTAKWTAYLEAKAPTGGPQGMKIRNELLFDLLPDQVNMLSVKRDHRGKSSDHLFQVGGGGGWQTVQLP